MPSPPPFPVSSDSAFVQRTVGEPRNLLSHFDFIGNMFAAAAAAAAEAEAGVIKVNKAINIGRLPQGHYQATLLCGGGQEEVNQVTKTNLEFQAKIRSGFLASIPVPVPVPGRQVQHQQQLRQVSSLPVGIALIRNYNGPEHIVVSILQTVKQIYMRIMTDEGEQERAAHNSSVHAAVFVFFLLPRLICSPPFRFIVGFLSCRCSSTILLDAYIFFFPKKMK